LKVYAPHLVALGAHGWIRTSSIHMKPGLDAAISWA